MKKNQKHSMQKDLVPFHVTKAAAKGDVGAINIVLQHYRGYISSLSTRRMYDEFGQPHYCVDETLYRRLETKLITKILDLKIA